MKQFTLATLLISSSLIIHQHIVAAAEKSPIISSAQYKRTAHMQALYPPFMKLESAKLPWSSLQKTSSEQKQENLEPKDTPRVHANKRQRFTIPQHHIADTQEKSLVTSKHGQVRIPRNPHPLLMEYLKYWLSDQEIEQSKQQIQTLTKDQFSSKTKKRINPHPAFIPQDMWIASQAITEDEVKEKESQKAITLWGYTGTKTFLNRALLSRLPLETQTKLEKESDRIKENQRSETIMQINNIIFIMPNYGNFHKAYSPIYLSTYQNHQGIETPVALYPSVWNIEYNRELSTIRIISPAEALAPNRYSVIP